MSKNPKPKHAAAKAAADKYITILVAEYHFLTKAATLLEVILNDPTGYRYTLEAVKATVEDMQRMAKAGAEQ